MPIVLDASSIADRLRDVPATLDQLAGAKRAKEATRTPFYAKGRALRARDIEALELAGRAMLVAAKYPNSFARYYEAMMGEVLL